MTGLGRRPVSQLVPGDRFRFGGGIVELEAVLPAPSSLRRGTPGRRLRVKGGPECGFFFYDAESVEVR